MTNEEIEKLIHMNQRLNLVLGYAIGFIEKPIVDSVDDERLIKYKWIVDAIENLIYLDKPLPRMP